MEKNYKFTIGQNVKIFDEDNQEWKRGKVTDKSRDTVFIKWDDLSEPTEHEQWEFPNIKLYIKK